VFTGVDLTNVRWMGSEAQRGTCNYHPRLSANRVTIIFGHKKGSTEVLPMRLLLNHSAKFIDINMLGLLTRVLLDELTKRRLELDVIYTWFSSTCNLVVDWH